MTTQIYFKTTQTQKYTQDAAKAIDSQHHQLIFTLKVDSTCSATMTCAGLEICDRDIEIYNRSKNKTNQIGIPVVFLLIDQLTVWSKFVRQTKGGFKMSSEPWVREWFNQCLTILCKTEPRIKFKLHQSWRSCKMKEHHIQITCFTKVFTRTCSNANKPYTVSVFL